MQSATNRAAGARSMPKTRVGLKRLVRRALGGRTIPDAQLTPPVLGAIGELAADVDALREQLAEAEARAGELEQLADLDPLLGVFNRRAFERELARTSAYARRYRAKASLIFIDLNKFKWINDVYGHKAGDVVLKHVAAILSGNIRRSDVLGRLGGDEFGVILVEANGATALKKAERLEAMIATTPVEVNGVTLLLTASAGAADITGNDTLELLMERADQAMYQSKETWHAGEAR